MVELEAIAYRLTPFAPLSGESLAAKIPGGEDRCREYIRLMPIQYIPAERVRIVEPLFRFLWHGELQPWIPMLSLACILDPDEADVLLDAVILWWCRLDLEAASPLMIRFGLLLMGMFNDLGKLSAVEQDALQRFRSFRSFWHFE